ncbi:MAG: hypothetical protein KAJ28_08280 [Flavobacteriaceae bacterium]|nr:hypothetical protein [Flavobacteriaceae bacterium]
MSKIIAILYSSLMLVQSFNIGFEDISKLNTLLTHVSYHQENYGDSFFDFLEEHYGNGEYQHGSNHEEHDELPFKHSHQTCLDIHSSFTLNTTYFDVEYHSFIEIPLNFFYKESHSLFEKQKVFQPPKLA